MRAKFIAVLAITAALATPVGVAAAPATQKASVAIATAIADTRRPALETARDVWRHPAETLAFFEVAPGQTIAEFYPGTGWYTRILAPLVKSGGDYIAIVPASLAAQDATRKLLADNTTWFGKTELLVFDPAVDRLPWPAGTADRVLTFRNVHNLLKAGDAVAAKAFTDFYRLLKPGGILGVVDHRLPEDRDPALERTSGYVKQSTVIRLAEAAGFKLAGQSEINANPKDSADWPGGVRMLPPTLRDGDKDRDRYLAIGESDRMTLKFVKPGS